MSNYGAKSRVWYTNNGTNGTPTWYPQANTTNTANTLPDMPVWTCVFAPTTNNLSNTKAILGTEFGCWSTTNLNITTAGTAKWAWDNSSPLTRITQLKIRPNDGLLSMSTYGRGLWRTDAFMTNSYNFNANIFDCTLNLTNTSSSTGTATWDYNGDGIIDATGNSVSICLHNTVVTPQITMTVNGVQTSHGYTESFSNGPKYPLCCMPIYSSKNINLVEDIKVYPNPTTGILHIQYQTADKSTIAEITIFDLFGRKIKTFDNTLVDLGINELANGMYILQLINNVGKTDNFKIQKQ